MAKFFGTFGQGYTLHHNFVSFEADNMQHAHVKMIENYGYKWAFVYDEEAFKGQSERYGLVEVPLGTPNERR